MLFVTCWYRVRLSHPKNHRRFVATVDALTILFRDRGIASRGSLPPRKNKICRSTFAWAVKIRLRVPARKRGREGEGEWGEKNRDEVEEFEIPRSVRRGTRNGASTASRRPAMRHDDNDHRFRYDHYLAFPTFTFSLYLEDRARPASSSAFESPRSILILFSRRDEM